MTNNKKSLWRTVLAMMISPATVAKDRLLDSWYLALGVSSLAFGLFFLQTGLDLYKTGQKGLLASLAYGGGGLIYGASIIPLFALILWGFIRIFDKDLSVRQAISAFCFCYSGALIYGLFGLLFSLLLGWKTALTFGVTGVIWATGPMIHTIRRLSGGKGALSIFLSTLAGLGILFSWSFFS